MEDGRGEKLNVKKNQENSFTLEGRLK